MGECRASWRRGLVLLRAPSKRAMVSLGIPNHSPSCFRLFDRVSSRRDGVACAQGAIVAVAALRAAMKRSIDVLCGTPWRVMQWHLAL